MKHLIVIFLLFMAAMADGQVDYQGHFNGQALRIDFLLAGGADREAFYLRGLQQEAPWAGPRSGLISPFGYGNYWVEVKDTAREKVLYRRGFSTLFEEWQTTRQAKSEQRAFPHTIRIPYPMHPVYVQISKNEPGHPVIWEKIVDPNDYFIRDEDPPQAEVTRIQQGGAPATSVDIAFVAEGYTSVQMDKFEEDVGRITRYIFNLAPFDQYRQDFNIYAVRAVSQQTGTDVPGEEIYKNTALNTSYYTFDVPRYLTTTATVKIRDYAANVPYDHIFVLVNTSRYGGGGFYNHYSATTSDHLYSEEVAVHEFGHGFAGLGDEYYNSEVAYNAFYDTIREPWEPNLTTLVNFKAKWKDMVDEHTPVPTPRAEKYYPKTGVFEGGGYVAEGVYSPSMHCKMKSNQADSFCAVCQRAIERMILYYLDEL